MFYIDTESRLWQIDEVAHRRHDFVLAAQVFFDRLSLGRRLNDYKDLAWICRLFSCFRAGFRGGLFLDILLFFTPALALEDFFVFS